MFAVEFVQTRERNADGTETVTRTLKVTERVTYKQDWPNYNRAQTGEKRLFLAILADLCRGIDEPQAEPRRGRPSVPLADQVFSAVFKIYSTVSARRFTCDLEQAAKDGHLRFGKAPHFNSVLRFLDEGYLTPVLKALVIESSKPLATVETDFAVDSSGFSTCRFTRWFDMKYGKTMEEREWVKVHIACGVKTNVITAVEIAGKTANDSPLLPPLVNTTAETFKVGEVSADAGYCSADNMQAVVNVGATPYIAFKDNTTGGIGGLFQKMFHYYSFNKDEFLKHYHKRSNVETTFNMVKGKFGDSLRSKSDVAMVNEALCKLLCHNICCLIQSVFELGIQATFWGRDEAETEAESVPPTDDDSLAALAWM